MGADIHVEAEGDTAIADVDMCIAVGEDLTQHYPGHPWQVGCNHESGMVTITLGYPGGQTKGGDQFQWGYCLHLSDLMSSGAQKRVMRAGGELLERFGVARRAGDANAIVDAMAHGLDRSGAVP